ncbi:MAG: hypothetical protein R3E66_23390 [bacterium]
MSNATQRNATRGLVWISFVLLCACGDLLEPRNPPTREQAMVSQGVDPVVGLQDYNVEIAQRVPALMNGLGPSGKTMAFAAMMGARTSAFQLNHNKNEPNQCAPQEEFGSAFASGYTTIVTSHHATATNATEVLYRFMLPAPKENRTHNQQLTPISDKMVYDRLYRLGFDNLWNSDWPIVEGKVSTWEVSSVPYIDWNATHGVDAMMWTTRPRCVEVFGGTGEQVLAMGPGLFTDWLRPLTGDFDATLIGAPLHAAHANSFQYSGIGLPLSAWAPPTVVLWDRLELDLWNLVSFPGYRGEPVDCARVRVGCANTEMQYVGCDGASIDLTKGSSGGAVFSVGRTLRAGAIGVVQGGYMDSGDVFSWGLLDDAMGAPNFDEMPTPQAHTIFTPFTAAMIKQIPPNKSKIAQRENGVNWAPDPDLTDTGMYTECNGPNCSTGCVGDCVTNTNTKHTLKCSNLYDSQETSAGAAIGVTGGARPQTLNIGDLGLVCGPLSSWSWTNFWDRVGSVRSTISDLLTDVRCDVGDCADRPFSKMLVTDWFDNAGDVESRPFQLCPPGFMMRGLELSFDGVAEGVTQILCARPSGERFGIFLSEPATVHDFDIVTRIGNPDPSTANHTIECGPAAPIMTGIEIFRSPNNDIVGLRPLCSESPPPISSRDECALPIPSGVAVHGDPAL